MLQADNTHYSEKKLKNAIMPEKLVDNFTLW